MSFGAACGWTSPAFLELTSQTNPLLPTGPINSVQASWIGCTVSLGAIAGTLFFGSIADRVGRKGSLLITSLPNIASWILLTLAQDVRTLCIARLTCGFSCGGIFILTPMFIAEIADDRIRGTLASSIVFSCNLGILGMFILGTFVSYRVYSAVFIVLPVTFFFALWLFIPETPQRLIALNKLAEAEKSLQFYHNDRNYRLPSLMTRKSSPDLGFSRDDLRMTDRQRGRPTLWQDLQTKAVRKAFLIGTVMMWFNQFCGLFTMMTFAGTIFQESGSSLSPNMSSIVVAVIQLLGSYCSTLCVDRFGRKILLAGSGFGIALGLTGLGLYIFCKVELLMDMDSVSWISLLCFCFPIFIGNCGIMAMPFVIVSEIFPLRVRAAVGWWMDVLIVSH